MSPLTYHRPRSVEAALELLQAGVPLAGGTTLVPKRRSLEAVVDLQDLGLDHVEADASSIRFGASLSLQSLYERARRSLPALADALRREAAWNLRNQGTVVGALLSGDGRSPLQCAALALDPDLTLAPGAERLRLTQFLAQSESDAPRLITEVDLHLPQAMAYEQVGRAPMDRPVVSAAACRFHESSGRERYRFALGGFGERPLALGVGQLEAEADLERAAEWARDAYEGAQDAWASAEYRSQVAATLIERSAKEVVA